MSITAQLRELREEVAGLRERVERLEAPKQSRKKSQELYTGDETESE